MPILFFFCWYNFLLLYINETASKSLFYIHEWPPEFADVYPPIDAKLDNETSYEHSFNDNNGAGKLLLGEVGLFQTWQFSLFKNLMSRLYSSRFRTDDYNKATAFIIPFDAGVHSFIDHRNGKRRLASPYGWTAIKLLQDASRSPVIWKNKGHDHFVIFSLTEFTMTGIGVKEFWMGICQNCTALTIEATPTKTSTLYHRSRKYWYSVPYPSSYHWWEGIRTFPWLAEPQAKLRNILSLFIGSVKTLNIDSNAFRRVLWMQCTQANNLLTTGTSETSSMTGGSLTGQTVCHWYNTSHSCNGVVNNAEQLLLLRKAQYCLAPPGDTVTRKSLFDSLLAGCVPVIFAKASLAQYGWHLSATDIEDIAVYIPRTAILKENVNFIDVLRAISPEELRKKQLAIERIAPRLQYSVVPNATFLSQQQQQLPTRATRRKKKQPLQKKSFNNHLQWDSPVRDAADVIIDRLLDRNTVEPMEGFSEEELRKQKCRQNILVKYHPDYAGLFPSGTKHLVAGRLWKKFRCEESEAQLLNETLRAFSV
eukprot:gene31536-40950_t